MDRRILFIILAAIAAAGLTITLLFAAGINPIVILLGAMALSVAIRFWARRG